MHSKRLGVTYHESLSYDDLNKQLAKMVRRGFSYNIAKEVLNTRIDTNEKT